MESDLIWAWRSQIFKDSLNWFVYSVSASVQRRKADHSNTVTLTHHLCNLDYSTPLHNNLILKDTCLVFFCCIGLVQSCIRRDCSALRIRGFQFNYCTLPHSPPPSIPAPCSLAPTESLPKECHCGPLWNSHNGTPFREQWTSLQSPTG